MQTTRDFQTSDKMILFAAQALKRTLVFSRILKSWPPTLNRNSCEPKSFGNQCSDNRSIEPWDLNVRVVFVYLIKIAVINRDCSLLGDLFIGPFRIARKPPAVSYRTTNRCSEATAVYDRIDEEIGRAHV